MMVGVLGGGQLGRMLALAGYPLGLHFRFLDSSPEAPAEPLADLLDGDFNDPAVLARFAKGLDVVTYEFENVPLKAAETLEQTLPVFPPSKALRVAQDRFFEKSLFQKLGVPTPKFAPVDDKEELIRAVEQIDLPAVLKTRRFGYDGKGQRVLRAPADVEDAWRALQPSPLILEQFIPFDRELSILAVRSRSGETAFYPLVENHHREGILRVSIAPAPGVSSSLERKAENYASLVMEEVDYVGVLAIEFFEKDGHLLANEMAPRVHNSGHWSIEGAESSQFENHLRAVCGLPLGSTAPTGRYLMFNLIGEIPDPNKILKIPRAHLHLYGKAERPGRKVGHVTLHLTDNEHSSEDIAAVQSALNLPAELREAIFRSRLRA